MGTYDRKASRRAIMAASIGNALEWYDFSIYAFFAIFIAQVFFPANVPGSQLFAAFTAFGIGFIIRPVGAVLLGLYGDRAGRKATLTLTILSMAVGTAVIGLAPSYKTIGIFAPLLLVVGRTVQGFSAGGEIGGAAAFLAEHAPPKERGKFASWLQASMAVSNILGALAGTAVTYLLTREQILSWGWRVPFLAGLVIAPVGLYLRRNLDETPHFKQEQKRIATSADKSSTLGELFRHHTRAVLLSIGISTLWASSVYTLIIYMPTYVQRTFGFPIRQAFIASLIGNCFMVAGCYYAGMASDFVGRRKTLLLGASLLLTCIYPLLRWMELSRSFTSLIVSQSACCIMVAIFTGVAPTALSELFPTRVRSTGMSLSYNLSLTVFGGFAPAFLIWFAQTFKSTLAPGWYVMTTAAIALIALSLMPPDSLGELRQS